MNPPILPPNSSLSTLNFQLSTNPPRLYAILDLGYVSEDNAVATTAALLAGGADILQLRAKNHDPATIRRVAETLIPLCRAAAVPFILNDHPALAAELGADGVHIGQDDGSLAEARSHFLSTSPQNQKSKILNQQSSISPQSPISNLKSPISNPPFFGRSTHSLAQARAALAEGFDYIGFGPLFPTPTKAGRPAIGLQEIATMEREVGKHIPAFCIGGIKRENLPQVLAAGARRVVIVSDLLTAQDVCAATREVSNAVK
jgi:thiamine-phosphate pyrophosphorylase